MPPGVGVYKPFENLPFPALSIIPLVDTLGMSQKHRKRTIFKQLVMANHTHRRGHSITHLRFDKLPKNKAKRSNMEHWRPMWGPRSRPTKDTQEAWPQTHLVTGAGDGQPPTSTSATTVYPTARWSPVEDSGGRRQSNCHGQPVCAPAWSSPRPQAPPGRRGKAPVALGEGGPAKGCFGGGPFEGHSPGVEWGSQPCNRVECISSHCSYRESLCIVLNAYFLLRSNMLMLWSWLMDPHVARSRHSYQIDPRPITNSLEIHEQARIYAL